MVQLLLLDRVACIRGDRLLFENLSLTLGRGQALWLRGPNGAGKSSLIRLAAGLLRAAAGTRSEEHTSELQSLMRISYAVFCLKKKNQSSHTYTHSNLIMTMLPSIPLRLTPTPRDNTNKN